MKAKDLLGRLLRRVAMRHGRFASLWRAIGSPDSVQWAAYLQRHGGLHRMGQHCSVQTSAVITDPSYVSLGNNVRLSGCTLFGHDGVVNMLRRAHGGELDRVGPIRILDNVFIGPNLVAQTKKLPWLHLLSARTDPTERASADLQAIRVQHFFGSDERPTAATTNMDGRQASSARRP